MIRAIVAVDRKLGMAKHGGQPWSIPTDEKYFLDQTAKYGGLILMGQRTFDVIGHPIKDRHNVVVTRQKKSIEGAEIVNDLVGYLEGIKATQKDLWVIGGASIFAQSLEYCDELYVTNIDAEFNCDQFFPEYTQYFTLKDKSEPIHENGFTYVFTVWERKITPESI